MTLADSVLRADVMDADVLDTVHHLVLAAFVCVTFLLFTVSLINRLRIQQVRLVWYTGRVFGWPAPPLAFLALMGSLMGFNAYAGEPVAWSVLAGYVAGGLFWLAAGLLSTCVLATAHGIVAHVGGTTRVVAWGQIVDYFDASDEKVQRYVFFYLDDGTRRRLELTVPDGSRDAFRCLVREKLDARFEYAMQQVYGSEKLEG